MENIKNDADLDILFDVAKVFIQRRPGAKVRDMMTFLSKISEALDTEMEMAPPQAETSDTYSPTPQSEPVDAGLPGQKFTPIMRPEDSISSDGNIIYCLIDGAPMKMLKRYIWRKWRLTPSAYREMFNLPEDYPMTAPGYSAQKRQEAVAVGLGTKENKLGRQVHAVDSVPTKEHELAA